MGGVAPVSEVALLSADDGTTISGEVTWTDKTMTSTVTLDADTTLTLEGTNKITCEKPLNLNGHNLTIQGTGSLEVNGATDEGDYQKAGSIYDEQFSGTSGGKKLIIQSGTVIVNASKYNGIALNYLQMDGGSLKVYGARAGIRCTQLTVNGGTIYATGDTRYGIEMLNPFYVSIDSNLAIWVSDAANAEVADLETGDNDAIIDDIIDGGPKTVYIGTLSGPLFSVKSQQGTLYEGLGGTATFAVSGKNVDMTTLSAAWEGEHTGLKESISDDGKILTVTADKNVKEGSYSLTLTATGTDGTTVSKMVTVTVSGMPITIITQPDINKHNEDLADISVEASLADGLDGEITYQWYVNDKAFTREAGNSITLTQDDLSPVEGKDWEYSGAVYCVLTYEGCSLTTDTVTVTFNTCTHEKYTSDGTCRQCGAKCSDTIAYIEEDGTAYGIAEDSTSSHSFQGSSGGTYYFVRDVQRTINMGNNDISVGSEDVILDLQGHSIWRLELGNFPYKTVTIKNGSVDIITTDEAAVVVLENVTLKEEMEFDENFDLTVKGDCVFEKMVTFSGTTHLQGGTFNDSIVAGAGKELVSLLADGYAFARQKTGELYPANDDKYSGLKVIKHTCSYDDGKCGCGRICDHVGRVDADGYCTLCRALAQPFAIGTTRYTSLASALAAAQEGDTVCLRGDKKLSVSDVGIEINQNIILDLCGHTLRCDQEAPVLYITAPDVTIRNGSVENICTAKSKVAVQVGEYNQTGAGLTVEDVTFTGSVGGGGTSHAHALNISSGNSAVVKSGTFTGGIYVAGSLTMEGGSTDQLGVDTLAAEIALSGGSFGSITVRGSDKTYASLLTTGYAYQNGADRIIKPEDMLGSTVVKVVKCTHPDGIPGDTTCPYCSKTCKHTDMDSTTGKCTECGTMIATISVTAGENVSYYNDLSAAVSKAAENNGSTVKLLENVALSGDNNIYIEAGVFTIDWNGCTLTGERNTNLLTIKKAEVTLTDTSDKKDGGVRNTKQGVAVCISDSSKVKIQGGHYAPMVQKYAGSATVQISGGVFEYSADSGQSCALDGGSNSLSDLMVEGYALFKDEACTQIIDLYNAKNTPEATTVYVGPHTHAFSTDGKCSCGLTCPHGKLEIVGGVLQCADCGANMSQYVASVVRDGKNIDYYEGLDQAIAGAGGETITLVQDVALAADLTVTSPVTLDLNGKNIAGTIVVNGSDASLTIAGANGTVDCVRQQAGNVRITSGEYTEFYRSASTGSQTQLLGGTFGKIALTDADGGLTCAGLLADGYAYADAQNTTVNGYVNTLTDVHIMEHPAHDCVWNTTTHEKICVCGYVEAKDTTAPVFVGIEDGKTYYGGVSCQVKDDSFPVHIKETVGQDSTDYNLNSATDKKDYSVTENEKTITLTATDAAGNTTSISFTLVKLYDVTLPTGDGYEVKGGDDAGNPQNQAGHGRDYSFTVTVKEGYSRIADQYKVKVNGTEVTKVSGDGTTDTFCVKNVSGALDITVEGIADITAPEAELEIHGSIFKTFINKITFGLFLKNTQTVNVTAGDAGSGIASVEYLLSETAFTAADDADAATGWKTIENLQPAAGKVCGSFAMEAGQKKFLYIRVKDHSGNGQIINSDGIVVYTDAKAMTDSVSFTLNSTDHVNFGVELYGNTVVALYNGDTQIEEQYYTVTVENGKAQFRLDNSYLKTLAAGTYTLRVECNLMGETYVAGGDEPAMAVVKLRVGSSGGSSSGGSSAGGGGGAAAPADPGKDNKPDDTKDDKQDDKTDDTAKSEPAPVDTKLKDSGTTYQVSSETDETPEVTYMKPSKKEKGTVTIPKSVTIDGVKYSVTAIAGRAFAGNKKVTKIVVPKPVAQIGARAFANCKNVKTIEIHTTGLTARNVADQAFAGIKEGTVIRVPKEKLAEYKKLFAEKGLNKKVKVKAIRTKKK